jgi:hypothetical protein
MVRSSKLMTWGGIMVGIGQVPLGLQYAHLPFALPLWWNSAQFPMWLVGTLGGIIVGVVGKGADDHSIPAQVQAAGAVATAQTPEAVERAKVQVAQADILAAKKP